MLCAAGVFVALLAVYLLTAPGRIDTVDGQWRYDVAKNMQLFEKANAAHAPA